MGLLNLFKPKADTIGGVFAGAGDLAQDIRSAITGDLTADQQTLLIEKATELQRIVAEGQAKINVIEAASPSLFVAGWRPFIGWACGTCFIIQVGILPILAACGVVPSIGIDITPLVGLLVPMLGLGTARTVEKRLGVQDKH